MGTSGQALGCGEKSTEYRFGRGCPLFSVIFMVG